MTDKIENQEDEQRNYIFADNELGLFQIIRTFLGIKTKAEIKAI